MRSPELLAKSCCYLRKPDLNSDLQSLRLSHLIKSQGGAGGKGSDSWSGRGSQPAWVKAHIEGGGTLEDLK